MAAAIDHTPDHVQMRFVVKYSRALTSPTLISGLLGPYEVIITYPIDVDEMWRNMISMSMYH